MKKFSISLFCVLFLVSALTAQVTFVEPDPGNNFGNINPGGLMGAAWGDYDKDGDLDMIIAGSPSCIYRNDISDSMRFVRVSAELEGEEGTILFDQGGNTTNTALWADLDGNGHTDLVLGSRIYLYDGSTYTFTTELLPAGTIGNTWGITAGDVDRDGDLDLACGGGTVTSNGEGPVHIFVNDGSGNFEDAAGQFGADVISIEAWCPQFVDADNDGYMDLWMSAIRCTDGHALFYNNQGAELTYTGSSETGIDGISSIVANWADVDNDGDQDLWTVALAADSLKSGGQRPYNLARLFLNNGDKTFTDVAPTLGLDSIYLDLRSSDFGDFDNDGDLDLMFNRRDPNPLEIWSNQLVESGSLGFTEMAQELGFSAIPTTSDRRTTCWVDYNNDGWLDIYWMCNSSTLPHLVRNEGGVANNWFAFMPKSITNNTSGIGTRIVVVAGGKKLTRIVQGGSICGNNGFLYPHFGLGSATVADSVIVYWPSGTVDVTTNVPAGKYYDVTEGQGVFVSVDENTERPAQFSLSQNYPNPFNPSTKIQFSLPERSDVRIVLVDVLGKVVKEVAQGSYEAGTHQVTLNASSLSTGIYFYKLEAGQFSDVKKLILMK